MAQITNVTSEALQAEIRRLLPSQQGFGEDLQATNVITPIIDLTSVAEGSSLGQNLQTALNLGGATEFSVLNGSSTIANVAGFYRIVLTCVIYGGSSVNRTLGIDVTDGTTTKRVFAVKSNTSLVVASPHTADIVVYINSGESIIAKSDTTFAFLDGSIRQIADVSGNLVNPVGFVAT